MTFTLQSPSFRENGAIPSEFTCDGENISPALQWQGTPPRTQSFVLIMDDPDAPAGVWDHWLLFNIPSSVNSLSADDSPDGALTGVNSWGRSSYGGPCPPDREHRYFFKLYALDTMLDLSEPDKTQLEKAMRGHILGTATLMGKYNRKGR